MHFHNTHCSTMFFLAVPTPVESVEVTLGFRGEYDDISAEPVVNQISKIMSNLKGTVSPDGIKPEVTTDVLYVRFSLVGNNKVDVAYRLEQMVNTSKFKTA